MSVSGYTMYDQLNATIRAFFDSYNEAYRNHDATKVNIMLTPDCRRFAAPRNYFAKFPDSPLTTVGETNEEYEKKKEFVVNYWKICDSRIGDTTIDVQARKAVVEVLHHCVTKEDIVYDFESMHRINFTEDGKLISRLLQFIDTQMDIKFGEDEEDRQKAKDGQEEPQSGDKK